MLHIWFKNKWIISEAYTSTLKVIPLKKNETESLFVENCELVEHNNIPVLSILSLPTLGNMIVMIENCKSWIIHMCIFSLFCLCWSFCYVHVCTLVSVSPRRAMLPALLLLVLTVLSSCSIEQRSAMRASRSTFSPWFNASANTKTSGCKTTPKQRSRGNLLITTIRYTWYFSAVLGTKCDFLWIFCKKYNNNGSFS